MKQSSLYEKRILVTGGCGFIGSHLVRHLVNKYPNYLIVNADALTYCGNRENLNDVEENADNYVFMHHNIIEPSIESLFYRYEITDVIHLAAESHVDNSLLSPMPFVITNVLGTANLLNVAKSYWGEHSDQRHIFYHVSTDEVYGSLADNDTLFTEDTKYDPHSPYSASKASSDHFVRAYHDSFNMQTIISNCSNNFGPYQYPEKLIPKVVQNLIEGKPIPVYGIGANKRDWLNVKDHVEAIDLIFHKAKPGSTYNIGGNNELKNIDLVMNLVHIFEKIHKYPKDSLIHLITFVEDRKGHDLRYGIDSSKLQRELGWSPKYSTSFEETVQWYIDNQDWLKRIEERRLYNGQFK